ncbi:hypothetical protein GCM10028895_48160 [Pontibacter rugosus]
MAVNPESFAQVCASPGKDGGLRTSLLIQQVSPTIFADGIGAGLVIVASIVVLLLFSIAFNRAASGKVKVVSSINNSKLAPKRSRQILIAGTCMFLGFLFLAPVETSAQTSKLACEGESVTHTFTYSGSAELRSTQWQYSLNGGSSYSNISGATSASYTFTANLADDSKYYRVRYVTRTYSWWGWPTDDTNYSQYIVLTVNPTPATPNKVDGVRCGSGNVTLGANGSTGSYRWYSTETSTTVLSTNSTYSPNVSVTRDYWVTAVNTTTGCESTRVRVTATVNPSNPAVYSTNNVYAKGRFLMVR